MQHLKETVPAKTVLAKTVLAKTVLAKTVLAKTVLVILMFSTLASVTACGKRGAPIRPSEVIITTEAS